MLFFLGLDPMMGRVQLAGFLAVMRRVKMMAVGQVGMVCCGIMIAALVMVGGILVMRGGLRMEFRGLAMMIDDMFGMGHDTLQSGGWDIRAGRE